jgi:cytochrome P450
MDAGIYQIYRERRERTPVYWDEERGLWAVYTYRHCHHLLSHPATLIPPVADGSLGGQALAVKDRLARISNPPAHDLAREMALRMFRARRTVDVSLLLSRLLPSPRSGGTIEWVSQVGKLLPAMHILAGFGFTPGEMDVLLGELPVVLKVMAPVTSEPMARALEKAFDVIYPIVDNRVALQFPGLTAAAQEYAVSNLIGLLIQGHDASKGLLSLALLHLLRRETADSLATRDMDFFLSFVTEVLRYDAAVHNTRRLLMEEVHFDGLTLPKGSTVLIVVAAGNRDPLVFQRPEEFDRNRVNNRSMLSFGSGIHGCIAGAYCMELAAQAMLHLFHHYRSVELMAEEPEYEPLANILMVKSMSLRLT